MASIELLKNLQNNPLVLSGFGAGDLWIFESPGLSWWPCCPADCHSLVYSLWWYLWSLDI